MKTSLQRLRSLFNVFSIKWISLYPEGKTSRPCTFLCHHSTQSQSCLIWTFFYKHHFAKLLLKMKMGRWKVCVSVCVCAWVWKRDSPAFYLPVSLLVLTVCFSSFPGFVSPLLCSHITHWSSGYVFENVDNTVTVFDCFPECCKLCTCKVVFMCVSRSVFCRNLY